jgi:hypothetical protein
MTRPIPTVQASPTLLRAGDMVHPDIGFRGNAFRVLGPAVRAIDSNGNTGWRVELEGDCVLLVPDGAKVRTQRRPQPQPTPRGKSEEDWEPDTVRRRVPARSN